MFCRKCGKFVPSDADLCPDCAVLQAKQAAATQPVPVATVNGSVMNGFGKALTAAILAVAGVLCAVFGFTFAVMASALAVEGVSTSGSIVFAVLFWVFAIGVSIPALMLGIRSIKLFIAEKKAGNKKPIPALALGCSAVAGVAVVAIFVICTLFFIALIGAVPLTDPSMGSGNYYY